MKKNAWMKRIKECCVNAGTYKQYFDDVIETLAETLEKRDDTAKFYKESGSKPIVTFTNKIGAENYAKNPSLVLWDELNKSALTYWRDLGLTPAGLKKIDEDALKEHKVDALTAALGELGV